jgi:hypothetical protein
VEGSGWPGQALSHVPTKGSSFSTTPRKPNPSNRLELYGSFDALILARRYGGIALVNGRSAMSGLPALSIPARSKSRIGAFCKQGGKS